MTIRLLTVLVIIAGLYGCAGFGLGVTCDEDSQEVKFAKSLSQERLAKSFDDVRKYKGYYRFNDAQDIPVEFSDLNAVLFRRDRYSTKYVQARFRLKGCLDHHVDLVVIYKPGDPKIKLVWGEHITAGSQILWRPKPSKSGTSLGTH